MSEATRAQVEFSAVQDLYKNHRYLDAFELSRSYWSGSTNVDALSIDELIMGCRLAARMGGGRLARWLIRKGLEREPSHPRVRYYSRYLPQRGENLFDRLRADQQERELRSGDPELDSGWLVHQAIAWGALRDFEHAHQCIARANEILPGDALVASYESVLFGLEDRWPDALRSAELALQIDPLDFFAVSVVAQSLLALGRVEEAAVRSSTAAEGSQSHELLLTAIWYQCALAETMDDSHRQTPLERARQLMERVPRLVPLCDRDTRASIARMHLELASLENDRDEIARWATEARAPFYRRVLENLRKNPQGRCIRLPFQRSKQKYQTCLPASLSAALATMNCPFDPAAMVADITHGGTSYWSAAEWLEQRGLITRFFAVTPEAAADLIRNGIAFILGMDHEDFSHAVAAVGLDEAAGILLFHDPNGFRSGLYLLDAIGKGEAPLGPRGMVVFPPDRTAVVDRILPVADCEATAALTAYHKALSGQGLAAARTVMESLAAKHPDHPLTRYLQALHACEEGRGSEGLAIFQDLLASYPNSGAVRSNLVAACRSLGNSALLRKTLADVVESASLPGVESQQNWRYPPAAYVCSYADLLRTSASSRRKARVLLNRVLNKHSSYAEAWRVLADCLWHEQDDDGRILALRIASCLLTTNENYARAYCDALAFAQRESEGLAWLEARTQTFHNTAGAAPAWTTWIAALEYWGHPEQALSAASAALEKCGNSPSLLGFLVPFFARMGVWEQAEAALTRLESTGNVVFFQAAATDFYDMRGDTARALQHAEQWVQEAPRWMQARRRRLELIGEREGGTAAAKLAAQWVAEHPGHDEFERLYCSQPESPGNPRWKRDMLLVRRVKRNPEDGWAWRDLLFRRLTNFSTGSLRRQSRLRPRILDLLEQCDRTAPEDPATLCGHAQWSEAQGNWLEAVSGWLKAIEASPANLYSYNHLWECCASFEEAEQRKLFAQVEPMLLAVPGRLTIAKDFAFLLAFRFGATFAEECVMRWKEHRPEDPDVIQAAADLLLRYGLGVTDATRAEAMLQPAVAQFPHHLGLRLALANAQKRVEKHDDAVSTLTEIVRRHPSNTAASIQLAKVLEQSGKREEAQQLMRSAAERNPQSPEIWDLRVQVLARARRFAEVRAAIAEGLQRLTNGVWWREKAINMLLECGDSEGAVEVAREGVRLYPAGGYLWHLLALTLKSAPKSAKAGEAEACWRYSVELNAGYFDPADHLAMLLVEQARFDEAEHLMLGIMPRMADPSPAKGRLAWIYRKRGKKKEAVDEMAWVLKGAPWFRWGWSVIMEWLVQDQAWTRAKSLLEKTPAALHHDVQLRQKRLTVLEHAGVPTKETDAEWNNLLRDFPRDLQLHMQRYDSLREQKRRPEAAAVLNAVLPLDPKSPWLQARLAEVYVDEGKVDDAINVVMAIWFAEVETSPWPADYCWQAAQSGKFEKKVYDRALELVKKGSRPTPHALSLVAAYALEPEKKVIRPKWRRWFPAPGVRQVLSLLELTDKMPGASGAHRAQLLVQLVRARCHWAVVDYWKRNQHLADNDTDLWGNAGGALFSTGQKKRARKLLADWKTRKGVKMWMVTNYVLASPQITRSQIQHVLSTCQDALSGLPHDHCAKYLVHVLAQTQILLGDVEGFRKTTEQYRSMLNGKSQPPEYFSKKRKYLLDIIPDMMDFTQYQKPGKLNKWTRWKMRIEESVFSRIGQD